MNLEEVYSAAWFANDFADLQPEFDMVADGIWRQFTPIAVVDVGCGPANILRRLRNRYDCNVLGIEGSKHGIDFAAEDIRNCIQRRDITDMSTLPRNVDIPGLAYSGWDVDLVVCTEVAEHLDEKHADALVRLLASASCPVVFTAAPPGQDGHHHVNCQPMHGYWEPKFNDNGMLYDATATADLRMRWRSLSRLSHMKRNVAVFR